MPKTEEELQNWVVEYNEHATHNRGLRSNYGYQAILDVNLVEVCADLRSRLQTPIRVLDVGCGDGLALSQLAEQIARAGMDLDDFELVGIGLNRYDQMRIDEGRFIHGGLNKHDFCGEQFHLVLSVFTFHYIWHKLEALEKIYNELLYEGGQAFVHFPGYLVRFGESPVALSQNEVVGNDRFQQFIDELESTDQICPMNYRIVSQYSDDDDCSLLAEFGHVRFEKTSRPSICFGNVLKAFAFFRNGFAFDRMNLSERTYVASHYLPPDHVTPHFAKGLQGFVPPHIRRMQEMEKIEPETIDLESRAPYRILSVPVRTSTLVTSLDMAVHSDDTDSVVIVCPGGCEPLAGRFVEYSTLAEEILKNQLGAVVRFNDPYNHTGDYADLLIEKLRQIIEYTLDNATHICATATPRLRIMAYSSSAGAAALLAAEYDEIESLLFIAPSQDVPHDRVLEPYRQFRGDVHVMVGELDEVVLPQQAFWYYENAENAASREYVEALCCGHRFVSPVNKRIFLQSPAWAFGPTRPEGFPAACLSPSAAWD